MNLRSILALALGCTMAALSSVVTAVANPTDLVLRWHDKDGAVVQERTLTTAEVEALAQVAFSTTTPWTSGAQTFSGPAISTLAALGSVPVSEALFTALNDYEMSVPVEDLEQFGAILAVRRNGELMPIKDKGPYWVMYPISSNPATLDTQFYHGRMVWQVKYIDFKGK
jgi:hypothetical protein